MVPSRANPIALWCRYYKARWGDYPDLLEADKGKLMNFLKGRSLERLELYFAAYFAMDNEFYNRERHPVSIFFKDLSKITIGAKTGVDPSKAPRTDYAKLLEAK